MKTGQLPSTFNPFRFVSQAQEFNGVFPTEDLTRLRQACSYMDDQVQVALYGERDEQGRRTIQGELTLTLGLACQRCMQPFDHKITAEVKLAIVCSDEEAKQLPGEYEPLLVDANEPVALATCIEDELLLSLPIAPIHDIGQCPAGDYTSDDTLTVEELPSETKRPNPFQVLAKLKQTQSDD